MINKTLIQNKLTPLLTILISVSICGGVHSQAAQAQNMAQQPVLVITNKPMARKTIARENLPVPPRVDYAATDYARKRVSAPQEHRLQSYTPTYTKNSPVYSRPARAPEITREQVSAGRSYSNQQQTLVGKRIDTLGNDLFSLQNKIKTLSEKLRAVGTRDRNLAAGYHASIATINTQLQTGTTPGNPRLIAKLATAESNLETLSKNMAGLNSLSVEISEAASRASYLLETVRSTYTLSGAVEEDHVRLAKMEDEVNTTAVSVDRLLNDINNDVARTTGYLGTERENLRTLSLGVAQGNLYGGKSGRNDLSQAPRSNMFQSSSYNNNAPTSSNVQPSGVRPLAKIRFNKANVNYKQPIHDAVKNAQKRIPNARFELMAVHPTSSNAAQTAIEKTRTRRNAENVLKTLTAMGVPLGRIDMSTAPSAQAQSSEVHIFVR